VALFDRSATVGVGKGLDWWREMGGWENVGKLWGRKVGGRGIGEVMRKRWGTEEDDRDNRERRGGWGSG
jgi:hypothetical protein